MQRLPRARSPAAPRRAARGLLALLALVALIREARASPAADLVLRGGAVYTLDAARSWAQAVAVRGGRIVYVGSDAGVLAFVGARTRVIALGGHMLLPGFQDAHVHPLSAGLEHGLCELGGLETREAVVAKIRACAAEQPGPWLVGSGWELTLFPAGSPDRRLLDELAPDRQVFFWAADGHSAWVSSRALAQAGIDAATPDPPGGRIERDPATREPSGTLRESAAERVARLLPRPTLEERRTALRWAAQRLVALGITAAQDASAAPEDLATYRDAERRGELPLRIVAALSTAEAMAGLPEGRRGDATAAVAKLVALRAEYLGPRLRPTGAKIFVDGVIESRTAAMLEPYLDRPGDRGEPKLSPEALGGLVAALVRERFSVHLHAIGDRAVRMSLDALEAAGARRGAGGPRHQIAHLEVIHPGDLPRFRRLGVIALFQPLWAYADPYITELTLPALGPERSRWIYSIGSAERAGAPLAFGSDWSVSSPDPLAGIQVALTREWSGGRPGAFLPEQAIGLDTALAAYTIGAAVANGLDAETGSIEVGKLADLAVVSQDLFDLPPARISTARVQLTLVEGEPVFRAPDFAW